MSQTTNVFEFKSQEERDRFTEEHIPMAQFKGNMDLPLSSEELVAIVLIANTVGKVTEDMTKDAEKQGIVLNFEEGYELKVSPYSLVVLNKDNKKFIIFRDDMPASMLSTVNEPTFKEGFQINKHILESFKPQIYTVPSLFKIAEKLSEKNATIEWLDITQKTPNGEEESGKMGLVEIDPEWIVLCENEELFS